MTNKEYIEQHPEQFRDDIDKWLFTEFSIIGGCSSAHGSVEYSVAKMVADVMDGFDFNRVHDVMVSLDWRWDIGCQERTVPSIYRLMKCAEDLLRRTALHYGEGGFFYTATGGLAAVLEDRTLTLQFVLEGSTAYEEDYMEEGEEVDNG